MADIDVESRSDFHDPAPSGQSRVEADLSELFLRFSSRDTTVKGFAGKWSFYQPDSADDEALNSSFRCLRTYETLGTDPITIKFRTFNQLEPGNGKATERSQDGFYESDHSRLATDPFFSVHVPEHDTLGALQRLYPRLGYPEPAEALRWVRKMSGGAAVQDSMVLSEAEQREGLPECVFWRCVAVDAQNVLRVAPKLPPKPAEMDEEVLAKYPGWSQQSIALGVFAFESFIEDGDNRWSMGALYSVHSLGLLSHFYIQEHAVTLDPSRKISFSSLPSKQPKPRLSPDVSTWLEKGSYKGEMKEVVWDEEGEMMKLPTRPATWSPPDPHSKTHRLFLYPDAMYAYYPAHLPEVAAQSPNTFNQGARFEMGGLCRENQEFRRLVLRYSPAGQVTSLTKELYKPSGSFEFEKRNSTSVRRSLDSRKSHTPPGAPTTSGRINARAAKLDQAFLNASD